MKQETIDGNRLIAEFMGFKKVQGKFYGGMKDDKENSTFPAWSDTMNIILDSRNDIPEYGLRFHSSWDWLMPIWFKIQYWYTREFGVLTSVFEISNTGISIKATHTSAFRYAWPITKREVTIEDIYTAVVEFIKWYNNQNSNA